jgi:SAM-dependent methyltransferase
MPRILRSVVPRIKKSIEERGIPVSLLRSVLLPLHLLREYRESRRPWLPQEPSPFDLDYGVDTESGPDGWTYLSDPEIPSANWIRGNNYAPIEPERFRAIIASLSLRFEEYVFVDYGSGKGRALLLASEFPFKRVIGLEFSPELHATAQQNIAKYHPPERKCAAVESLCMDFLDFVLPLEPLVLFFFNPCDTTMLVRTLARIQQSLNAHPREIHLVYASLSEPKEQLLDSTPYLTKTTRSTEWYTCVYKTR